MKNKILFFCFLGVIFITFASLDIISGARFNEGDELYFLVTSYAPSEEISGWINLSLKNISSDAVLEGLGDEINIKEFLNLNKVNYTCYPVNCSLSGNISSDFIKLDLKYSGFKVDSDLGEQELLLELDGEEIFSEDIEIIDIPKIIGLNPTRISALKKTNFVVSTNSNENLTYTWDFRDGSDILVSNLSSATHTYSLIGEIEIVVSVSNSNGEATKTFTIEVNTTKSELENISKEYIEKINLIESQINSYPLLVKQTINNQINLSEYKLNVEEIKTELENLDENDSIGLITAVTILGAISLPDSINITQIISPSQVLINSDLISENSETISMWTRNNLNLLFESKTYSIISSDIIHPLVSSFKLKITPKDNIDERAIRLLILGEPSEIIINGEYSTESDENFKIINLELDSEKEIEIILPGEINLVSLPFYIVPASIKIPEEITVLESCGNDICEKELGENKNTCIQDCPSYKFPIILVIILFIIVFIIYIILQEWYKRYYEGYLFDDKVHLFNIINFMNNSESQGLSKSEIFKKLKETGWSGEQLEYAWRKLHGKRTGMWEIPIFKFLENRKVKGELNKREGINNIPRYR